MRRRVLALAGLALLLVTSGCLGGLFGGGEVDPQQLDQGAPEDGYAWDAQRDVHITLTENARFRAVYEVNRSNDPVELFRRDGFGGQNPLEVRGVRFRYPNGTVINGSEFAAHNGSVSRTRDALVVDLPSDTNRGQLAFTSESTPKRFSLPTYVDGSYEVVLPPNRRVDFFLFGSVSPGGAQTRVDGNGRLHVVWENVTSNGVSVQYYLQRDLFIFAGIAAVLGVVAVVGLAYYRRQIQRLRERREEMGVDVDIQDDEFDDGPPPGMG